MIRTAIWGALALAVAGAGAYIVWTGVMMHYVRIDNTMRWECVRDAQNVAPGGQTVRLTFVDSPSFVDTISGRALCDRAARNGRPVVRVTFIAWGNRYRGLVGYREDAIDGSSIEYVRGPGGSADNGSADHPLSGLFR